MIDMTHVGRSLAFIGALLWVGAAQATDPVVKCQEAKLKAEGKLQSCLRKNSAKVLGGKPDASAQCQTAFADALAKVDAKAMKKGATCRYVDNGDGTVTDLNTGLQWEKKDNLDGVANDADPHDADNVYTWCSGMPNCTNSANLLDGTAYTDFLAILNNGASTDGGAMTPITNCFANHCDWRLPTIVELAGIVDATQGQCNGGSGACIDPAFGPTYAYSYWSATSAVGGPPQAWEVDFDSTGDLFEYTKPSSFYARAVRGGL